MHNMVRLQTVLIVDWILNILKMKYKTISDITINKIKSEKFVIVFSASTYKQYEYKLYSDDTSCS